MSTRRRHRIVGAAILAVSSVFGCQFIVSDEIEAYSCAGTDPSACPSGMVCDPNRALCINKITCSSTSASTCPEGDVCDEARGVCVRPQTDAGPADVRDGGPRIDTGTPDAPAKIGEECSRTKSCDEGLFCATSSVLTTKVVQAAGTICSKPCCTSEQCEPGFVCYGTATGGNYCVAAKAIGRNTTGSKRGGETCTADQCRSGLCTDGRCSDTCCGPSTTCATGTTCRRSTVDGHEIWSCAPPPTGAVSEYNTVCANHPECKSNYCVIYEFPEIRCLPTCCTNKDCTDLGFQSSFCSYEADLGKKCYDPTAAGATKIGQTCTQSTDCETRYCDTAETRTCARVCCTTADCPSGEECLPSPSSTPHLRCVKRL